MLRLSCSQMMKPCLHRLLSRTRCPYNIHHDITNAHSLTHSLARSPAHRYHFYYWFGFPALKASITVLPPPGAAPGTAAAPRPLLEVYTAAQVEALAAGIQALATDAPAASCFL